MTTMTAPHAAALLTDGDLLLRGIVANPEDDAPRLQYADWLTENGQDARGEFIRAQVELARTKVHPNGHTDFDGNGRPFVNEDRDCTRSDCRACDLRRRERILSYAHLQTWFPPIPDGSSGVIAYTASEHGDSRGPAQVVRRGFVESITTTMAAYLGGECGRCGGRGGSYQHPLDDPLNTLGHGDHWYPCPDCVQGRLPGAAAVCQSQPVTRVVLSDREPWRSSLRDGTYRFAWYNEKYGEQSGDRADLPADLFRHLTGGDPTSDLWVEYDTRDAALEVLSAAAITYGRTGGGA